MCVFWWGSALAQYAKVQRGLLSALLIFYPICFPNLPNLLFLPKNLNCFPLNCKFLGYLHGTLQAKHWRPGGRKNSTCLHYKSIYARMLLGIGEKDLIPCQRVKSVVVRGFLSTTWEAFQRWPGQRAGRQGSGKQRKQWKSLGCVREKCVTLFFRKRKIERKTSKATRVEELENSVLKRPLDNCFG